MSLAAVSAIATFVRTCIAEGRRGRALNAEVRRHIFSELRLREVNVQDPTLADEWALFDKKLLRPRPRLFAFVSAYAMLSEQSHASVVSQGGMMLFRAFWGLAATQDDLIDEIPRSQVVSLQSVEDKTRKLYTSIFGEEQIFYRAVYSVIAKGIDRHPRFGAAERTYLKTTLARWYHFLVRQEVSVLSTDPRQHDFSYCKNYRERQDEEVTKVLTACLNGTRCLEPAYQRLETVMRLLAYRSQMIDDLSDTGEDLKAGRPNYAVGALNAFPEERNRVEDAIRQHNISKFTPRLLQRLAPQAYALLLATYAAYGQALVDQEGFKGTVLDRAGVSTFYVFPIIRNMMYHINPRYANF